jgi:hypothetical protein
MKRSGFPAFISSALVCAALSFLCLPAGAQPVNAPAAPREKVIVTAPWLKPGVTPNAIAHDFIFHYAAPTILRDAIPRWQTGICPQIQGLAPQYEAVVMARLKDVVTEAAAPKPRPGCKPNLLIYFTPDPQALLDTLTQRSSNILGYHGVHAVTHPVQAWYVTGTRDIRGQVFRDEETYFDFNYAPNGQGAIDPSSTAPVANVGGWRFRPDLASDLLQVTIIVDSSKTAHYLVGEMADYIAMLALTQTKDFEGCEPVASIANLLSDACDDGLRPEQITATDIAFLRGVYKMDAGAALTIQQDQIAGEMAAALAGGK